MSEKLLTKKFFKENPCQQNTVQQFIYSILLYKGCEEMVDEIITNQIGFDDECQTQITREKKQIQAEQNPEAIVQLMRQKIEMINRVTLIKKALEFEEVILPLVIDKLMTNNQNIFIENSIRLLALSQQNPAALLKQRFGEIRSPYVQSLVCLIIGFRGDEDSIPWMMERYCELKKLYPSETYDQGPLLALYELNERFYKR